MVVNLGYGLNIYKDALCNQLAATPYLNTVKFVHPLLSNYTAQLSQSLPDTINGIFFTTSGAESTETAIKTARRFTGRQKVLYRNRSYHGGSYAALSVSGDARQDMIRGSEAPHAVRLPHPEDLQHSGEAGLAERYLEEVARVIQHEGPGTIAAIFLETVTGGSGMYGPPPGLMAGLRQLCSKHGILLIADEVMTGFGRTGTMWAFEQEGYIPDIVTMGKGITNGVCPLGAVAIADHVLACFNQTAFPHGSTNNSHLLSVAAAEATLKYMHEYDVLANVKARETQMRAHLERFVANSLVQSYRLRGLMGCIVCHPREKKTGGPDDQISLYKTAYGHLLDQLYREGLYTIMRDNLIFIGPPLTITEAELHDAMMIIERVLLTSADV
eukprot:TRINITY_DN27294_c0_g1_i1.p1 TRINITY_DN27294_c0_g1~~TRINITY_DN27294_c0_g1_i1.p1  ORF type:complete len:385 (+),score=30.34 TRINITY_DN27294_c0_g1_i1:376-1530(+)